MQELPEVDEPEIGTFIDVARAKAAAYSKLHGGYAISSDGGAEFPGLVGWNPLTTRRFIQGDDQDRIKALLGLLKDASDRTVIWKEAIAVAHDGEIVFSAEASAMDGVIDERFDQDKYQEGIWLCSITSFPELGGRNYFDLSPEERLLTEDSWSRLAEEFSAFAASVK